MSEVVSSSSSSSNAVESNRQNFNIDWRSKKPIFDEQMGYFCMKEEMADVEFVFDRQDKITKIPAHSFALAVASEVFQKELKYGSENGTTEKRSKDLQVIEVKDERVEIDALKTALLFIYNAYKKVELTGESALAVLYIAMKYMIKQLESLCVNYLLNNINAENVFTIFQFCIDRETDSQLMGACKEFIRSKTESVLKADSFPEISHKCLSLLLEQDSLNIAEVNLFKAAVRWAKFACKKTGKDPNDGKCIRSQLGTALRLIRFPAMTTKDIAEFVGPTGILNWEEQRDLLYVIGGADPLGPLISTKAISRKQSDYFASMDVLKHVSYTLTKNKLSLLIRIDNFPSFVTSKARIYTRDIIVNNTRLFIVVGMTKYCQTSAKYIWINAKASDHPEILAAYIIGRGEEGIDCSFDVVAKFKFKQPHPMDNENEFTRKFCFNSLNGYGGGFGFGDLAKINDLLDPQKGYLVDNALELLVDVTITEAENE